MSEIEKLADDSLESVSGGVTAELKAAYACINGTYGNGSARVAALRREGLDPAVVQSLVHHGRQRKGCQRRHRRQVRQRLRPCGCSAQGRL